MKKEGFELEQILKSIRMIRPAETSEEKTASAQEAETPEEAGYSREEMEQSGFGEAQMEEIESGLRQQVMVENYAKTYYNWKQMRELRMGMLEDLDISLYNDKFFSAEQMREIRMGLLDHLDVSSYARLVCSAKDMAAARKGLLSEIYHISPDGHARQKLDENGIRLRFSDDCMQVYLKLPPDRTYSVPELERMLYRYDVCHGISREQLKKAASGECGTEEIMVASGTPVRNGRDGSYEYFFHPLPSSHPKLNEDGSVDYTQMIEADRREAGEDLVQYHPAEKGMDGETVTGVLIRSSSGKELKALNGHGFVYDKEKNLYTADTKGYVVLDEENGTLNVWDVFVVDGDVNRYNGNISYDGMIHIRGSVTGMVEIEATGNVVVDGYVEGACIRAGNDIILHSGMNGNGTGRLEAGGRVHGRFFEAAVIRARGNVEGAYFLNCDVETDGSLIASESRSRIVGGSVYAGYSVEVCSAVNSGRSVTAIHAGDPVQIEKRVKETESRLEKTKDELRQLTEGRKKILDMSGALSKQYDLLYNQICVAVSVKEEEEQDLEAELCYLARMKERAKRAYIRIINGIRAGVILSVGGKVKKIEKDMSGAVTFRREVVQECGTKY